MKCTKCNRNLNSMKKIDRMGVCGGYVPTTICRVKVILCIRCYNDEYDKWYSLGGCNE